MVSAFSNPGFPPVDVHPTRLPVMDARLSAAIDSFEASMRAALRDAIREALDSAFANFTTNFSRDWALLRRDSALRAEGVSDPVPTTSDDTQSIDLGHPGLQGDDNPPRPPSPVQVHSVPPLLSSSPLLRALATPVVKPHSIDSVAAIVSLLGSKTVIPDSVMTTASQLLPDCSASMFSNLCKFSGNEFTPPTFFRKSGAEFMKAQPSMIAHKCQQGLVRMYARYVFDEIPDSCCCVVLDRDMCYCKGIQDKGGGSKFRSPDECRRKLEEKIAKSDYDVSIGCFITKKLHVWCQLPRVLWIRRHEVLRSLIYNLSHGEAKWYWILLFILAYYTNVIVILYEDSLTEKCGWVNWYLVGKFVKKDCYALKLFEEMSKKPLCEKHPMAKFVWSVTNNTATAEWYNACQEALNNKGTLFHFMLLKTFHLTIHGNSELHIATSWQMLKSFWNASTITDYILEIEFFWEKDIKVVLWVGNATLIFSALESWLVVEHNKRGFAQQWLSLTFSWATSEAVMAKAWSQWYFPYQKTQVPILKAQVKSSSVFPSYMAYQPDINKKMRAILIDWLIKVHYKFELLDETQFLTVHLIDRFLERQTVFGQKLQLVDVTATLLACKYEEVYGEMLDKGVNPDEFTYVLLRVKRLTRDIPSYQFIMKTLSDAGKLDKVLNVVDTMRDDDRVEFFNNPITKAMLFLNFASESSDVFKSTYREVAEKYKKEDISFIIGDLKVVVTDGIQEYINYRKYVWAEFYAPWCGHCKKLVPILDEVAVSYENDSNVVIAKLQATANGVPSDFDVKYYQLPQRLQDQMLAHLCLKFRTDSEDLEQQEPLDMVYLFLGVSNDLLFQWVSAMKAGVYAFFEHLAQFYKIIVYSDYSYMYVDHVMERLDTKHCVTQKLGKAATMYQIAEETYTTQTAVLENAMPTPVFVQGSSNSVCNRYQLRAVVYTTDEDLESITDTQNELQPMELDAHNFVKFRVQNSHYPNGPLQKENKFIFNLEDKVVLEGGSNDMICK